MGDADKTVKAALQQVEREVAAVREEASGSYDLGATTKSPYPEDNMPRVRDVLLNRIEMARARKVRLMDDAQEQSNDFNDLTALCDILPADLERVSWRAARALRKLIAKGW